MSEIKRKKAKYQRTWFNRQTPEKKAEMYRIVKDWHDAHAKEMKEYKDKWYRDNKERQLAKGRIRRAEIKADPRLNKIRLEKQKIRRKRAKAKVRMLKHGNTQLGERITHSEWLRLVIAHDSRCFYCKKRGPVQQDHYIPLSKGGDDSMENIVPACEDCNRRKQARDPVEFIMELEERGLSTKAPL